MRKVRLLLIIFACLLVGPLHAQQQALRVQPYNSGEAAIADFHPARTALIIPAYTRSTNPSMPWEAITFFQVFAPDDLQACDIELGSATVAPISCAPLAAVVTPKWRIFGGVTAEADARAFYASPEASARPQDRILWRKSATVWWVSYATCGDLVLLCP